MPRDPVVRFEAKGEVFTIATSELLKQPDSYLAWVARSHPEKVKRGQAIRINKNPAFVRRLIQYHEYALPPSFLVPTTDPGCLLLEGN